MSVNMGHAVFMPEFPKYLLLLLLYKYTTGSFDTGTAHFLPDERSKLSKGRSLCKRCDLLTTHFSQLFGLYQSIYTDFSVNLFGFMGV